MVHQTLLLLFKAAKLLDAVKLSSFQQQQTETKKKKVKITEELISRRIKTKM